MLFSEVIKQILEIIKHIANIMPKKCFFIFILTFALFSVVFLFKPNLINFLKTNMKTTFFDIQSTAEYYNRYTENEITNTVEELAKIIKSGKWVVQGMQNKKIFEYPATVENWHFQSRIIYLKEYDYEKKVVIDARHKRKDKSLLPISHDTKTTELNKPRFWNNTSDIEYTENYIEDGGANVETMFGQFWFNVYIKGGASACENPDALYALRSVILLDKEAFESIEGTKTQKEKILIKYAEKLRDDHIKGIIIPKY